MKQSLAGSSRAFSLISFILGVAALAASAYLCTLAWSLRPDMQPGSEPLEISVADFQKTRPDTRWLKLTDCDLFLDCAIFGKDDSGEVRFLVVPMWALRQRDGTDVKPKTSLAMVVTDPQVIAAAKEPVDPLRPGFSQNVATSFGKIGRGIEPLEGILDQHQLSQEQKAKIFKLGQQYLKKDFELFIPGRPWTTSGANWALGMALLPGLLGLSWLLKSFQR